MTTKRMSVNTSLLEVFDNIDFFESPSKGRSWKVTFCPPVSDYGSAQLESSIFNRGHAILSLDSLQCKDYPYFSNCGLISKFLDRW